MLPFPLPSQYFSADGTLNVTHQQFQFDQDSGFQEHNRCPARFYRFFPPTKGLAAACFIHEATWCSSRSSTDARSTPRVDLPITIGVTGGSGLISVPRMNISFT